MDRIKCFIKSVSIIKHNDIYSRIFIGIYINFFFPREKYFVLGKVNGEDILEITKIDYYYIAMITTIDY